MMGRQDGSERGSTFWEVIEFQKAVSQSRPSNQSRFGGELDQLHRFLGSFQRISLRPFVNLELLRLHVQISHTVG